MKFHCHYLLRTSNEIDHVIILIKLSDCPAPPHNAVIYSRQKIDQKCTLLHKLQDLKKYSSIYSQQYLNNHFTTPTLAGSMQPYPTENPDAAFQHRYLSQCNHTASS